MADSGFQREFLDAHNTYRNLHGSPPLALSSELNTAAQRWAENLLSLGLLNHSDTSNGENLYTVLKSHPLTAKDAVDAWYEEVNNYSWSNPGFRGDTGHFTQVVWKESTHLGVGVATAGTRSYVVAQYHPAGNMTMPGYFEKNVLPKVTA
ncbi:Golgi-associated plant pathogenesis-related protein 1-like isoform X2 [Solea solea]|uniref:Golgi-associated plant pathogenesis-related protein 1-like isoform X2 n=1 Tax=Solea solea TaxID=90069 RepID=UPI00272CA460|nr:Golgi-associated plant pathogenesis-related protein 1-like isoform X2 [Solea solea]